MLTNKERQVLELRKRGFKQVDIADKLKISQPAVSAFESNALKKISEARKILEIAKKLGVEYEEE